MDTSLRITPARAGTTRYWQGSADRHEDHPRSRGNNPGCPGVPLTPSGSPPLAREQRCTGRSMHRADRITPARAGTTPLNGSQCRQRRDHPRSRGNNENTRFTALEARGSPPLAREQQDELDEEIKAIGITPARAGTTVPVGFTTWPMQDHPRSRGNNRHVFILPRSQSGSPPLAREQPRDCCCPVQS